MTVLPVRNSAKPALPGRQRCRLRLSRTARQGCGPAAPAAWPPPPAPRLSPPHGPPAAANTGMLRCSATAALGAPRFGRAPPHGLAACLLCNPAPQGCAGQNACGLGTDARRWAPGRLRPQRAALEGPGSAWVGGSLHQREPVWKHTPLTSFGAQASGVSQPGSPRSALKKQQGGVRTCSVKPLHDADDGNAARKSLVGLVIAGRCPAKDPHVLKNIFNRAARFVVVLVPRAVLFAVRLAGDGCAVHASKKDWRLGKFLLALVRQTFRTPPRGTTPGCVLRQKVAAHRHALALRSKGRSVLAVRFCTAQRSSAEPSKEHQRTGAPRAGWRVRRAPQVRAPVMGER